MTRPALRGLPIHVLAARIGAATVMDQAVRTTRAPWHSG